MRLTELLHVDVVDEDGHSLGTPMELRCRRALRGRVCANARIDALLFAAPGFLEHMGIRRAASCEAAWKDVLRIERDRVVVRRYKRST